MQAQLFPVYPLPAIFHQLLRAKKPRQHQSRSLLSQITHKRRQGRHHASWLKIKKVKERYQRSMPFIEPVTLDLRWTRAVMTAQQCLHLKDLPDKTQGLDTVDFQEN